MKATLTCSKCNGKIWSMRYMMSSTRTSGGIKDRRYCPACNIVWKIRQEEDNELLQKQQ